MSFKVLREVITGEMRWYCRRLGAHKEDEIKELQQKVLVEGFNDTVFERREEWREVPEVWKQND